MQLLTPDTFFRQLLQVLHLLAAVCGVTSAVPHGGLVVALFKATNYMSLYFLCVMAGTALSIAIVLAFKRRQEKNR